jgi:hypothetical protein
MNLFPPYYELRLYKCEPGRIPDLHQRMGHDVKPLFARHGVQQPLAYWTSMNGPMAPLYAYLLRWGNLDERMAAFGGFYTDPEWLEQRERSNAGRQMVERIDIYFMSASSAWRRDESDVVREIGGVHELRIQQVLNGQVAAASDSLAECDLPFLEKQGAIVLGIFDMRIGPRYPQSIQILAWESEAARLAAWREYDDSAEIAARRGQERARFGRPLFEPASVCSMEPAPYGVARANFGDLA